MILKIPRMCRVVTIFFVFLPVLVSTDSDTDQECLNYQFACTEWPHKCIDKISVCDGIRDCAMGSDETEDLCNDYRTCTKDNFRCTYGACVSLSAKCDGRVDCVDKSDENHPDCPVVVNQAPNSTCKFSEYQCKSGKCLDFNKTCDGSIDCADGSDETTELCAFSLCENGFLCDYGGCIANTSVCDGKRTCADGSDEFFKLCKGMIWDWSSTTKQPSSYAILVNPDSTSEVPSSGYLGVSSSDSPDVNTVTNNPSTPSNNRPSNTGWAYQASQEKRIIFRISTSNASNISISVPDSLLTPGSSTHRNYQSRPTRRHTNAQSPINQIHNVQDAPTRSHTNVQNSPSTGSIQDMNMNYPITSTRTSPEGSIGTENGVEAPTEPEPKCPLPIGIGRNYTIKCLKSSSECESEEEQADYTTKGNLYSVGSNTTVSYSCNKGYVNKKNATGESQCLNGITDPEITPCVLECPALEAQNHMDFSCFYLGDRIDCHGRLPVGTTVRPRCAPFYRETFSNFDTIKCQSNGEWTNKLFECIPECGKIRVRESNMKKNTGKTEFSEAPWFAAIYRMDKKDKPFVCSGTIVTPSLVVSAAQCFYDVKTQTSHKPENFILAVSKYSRNYNVKGTSYTKTYQIQQIVFPPEYTGDSTADVAILRLKTEISLNAAVSPACIRWPSYNYDAVFSASDPENVVDKGRTSSFLVAYQPEQIHLVTCLKNLTMNHHRFVPVDKLCNMNQSNHGKNVHEGDRGGGFLYSDPDFGQFYLLGVLSNSTDKGHPKTVVTDIRNYLNWLDDWRKRVDEAIKAKIISK